MKDTPTMPSPGEHQTTTKGGPTVPSLDKMPARDPHPVAVTKAAQEKLPEGRGYGE